MDDVVVADDSAHRENVVILNDFSSSKVNDLSPEVATDSSGKTCGYVRCPSTVLEVFFLSTYEPHLSIP